MIQFKRYPHIADLLEYYIESKKRNDISEIYRNGIKNETDAEVFCKFIWDVVESIHSDSELEILVLGNTDNTDMLPDLAYEITNQMKQTGYYSIWEATLDQQE
ncbi:hypothetical protein CBP51_05265 [Cellvibrio mixtus]|uniref:Uncharacterized protein n=1 Tax=Cellvibrio mixtus TaxID=39650 RepID=A0A266Q997_9GAMM|nr:MULTISPECIES: hypothetical protein [Cellvibrio]AQT60352.1 hypothetical protein B0D95_09780 [Cellvibrio sp. PSBB023]OZY86438.1 hypothetical protein CBP51_05265 [Cellvibrio mixtus]